MAVSVLDFGALGNDPSDAPINDAAIAAAIASSAASGGGRVLVPSRLAISAAIQLPTDAGVVLQGEGRGASVIRQVNGTAGGVVCVWDGEFSFKNRGGGIRNITIESGDGFVSSGSMGPGSTGTGISAARTNPAFVVEDFGVHNFANPLTVEGGWYSKFWNGELSYFAGKGVLLTKHAGSGDVGAGRSFRGLKISNNGYTGSKAASVGHNIRASGGDFLDEIDITSCGRGLVVDPAEGDWVLYGFLSKVLVDTSLEDGAVFDATLGKIMSMEFDQFWAAYNGGNGATIKGTVINLDGLRFNSSRFRENGKHGADLQGGSFVRWRGGEFNSNGQSAANTFDGLHVAANVNNFSADAIESGNRASTLPDRQRCGVKIEVGGSFGWAVRNSDLRNNLTAALANGSTSSNFVATGNII
jgi:hypothetical protein